MPESNVAQAMFPIGSNIIPNGTGTAPGVDLTIESDAHRCRMFAMPGVPAELKLMWRDTIRPALIEQNPEVGFIKHHSIHSFGLAESDVETRLPNLIQRGRVPVVGITASKATITLRISAQAVTESECDAIIEPTAKQIHDELSEFIFGENEVTLQQVVVKQLREVKRRLAVVDAGNCSLIADWLHEVDPQGDVYRGIISVASQSNEEQQMALCELARKQFHADLILLIGPPFEHAGIEKRDVAIQSPIDRVRSRFNVTSNPSILVPRSIKQALNF